MIHRIILGAIVSILVSGSLVGAQQYFSRPKNEMTQEQRQQLKKLRDHIGIQDKQNSESKETMTKPKDLQKKTTWKKGWARRALDIIQKHKAHIDKIENRISGIIDNTKDFNVDTSGLENIYEDLEAQAKLLLQIETTIITKSWTKENIRKQMENLRPTMKTIMQDMKEQLWIIRQELQKK